MSGAATRLAMSLARVVGGGALRVLASTLRFEVFGWEEAAAVRRRGPVIVAFWHARFLVLPWIYPHDRPVGLLISPSRDGDLLAGVMESLGREPIRGSSRRGGRAALVELDAAIRRGWDVAIAVDGPLGPPLEAKPGALWLAQRSGAPILPVVYGAVWGKTLRTWDQFLIPAPFSRIEVRWGAPLSVAADEDLPAAQARLDAALRTLLAEVDRSTGRAA